MNIFGNSLKFTAVRFFFFFPGTPFRAADKIWQDGYVHVIIRHLPSTPDVPPNRVKLELAVVDTGKVRTYCHTNGANLIEGQQGISQDFLKASPVDHRGNRVTVLTTVLRINSFILFLKRIQCKQAQGLGWQS